MVFKRKKLLNSLLLITLCTTLIPLFVAGLYFIPKTGYEIKKATQERLLSHTTILSHFIENRIIMPTRFFLRDLAIKTETPTDLQFNLILEDHADIKSFLNSVSETYSNSTQKILYVNNNYKIEPTFWPDEVAMSEHPDSIFAFKVHLFIHTDSSKYIWLGLKTSKNSIIFAIVDISGILNNLSAFVSAQNFDINYGVIDLEDRELLYYRSFDSPNNKSPNYNEILFVQNESMSPFYQYRLATKGDYLGAYSDIHSFVNWRIIAELPESLASNTTRGLWFNYSILLMVGFIFAVLGTIYYGRRITKPLERFARTATEIARGNFDQRVQLETDDEIGRLARIFNYMVIELGRLNNMNLNKIITERTKTKTIIKNIGDGIIVSDEKDKIVLVNATIEKWFRIYEDDVVDKPVRDVLKEPELWKLFDEIKESDLEGTFTRKLSILLPGQAKEKIFQSRATKILNQKSEYVGIIAIFHDITREAEIDRMKTELVSMVAHELRSPLTSISGFAELLLSEDNSVENIPEFAGIIRDESNRLANLVNKFLDITKIEAGRMDYIPAIIPVKEILDSTLHIAAVLAQKKDIIISADLPDERMTIYADHNMMCEVILNLLSNAIIYSPDKAKIKIRIEEDGEMMNISVIDQGFGIAPKHKKNIFKKFYRIKDDPRNTEVRGTGLGLPLVKEIVELHDGKIIVKSELGSGSTFTVCLPRQKNISDL